MEDIYVQIPAYRDSELRNTLASLYGSARRPRSIRVRVLWQYGPGETLDDRVQGFPNLEIDAIPAKESSGCNWARSRLQAAWSGEPYTLLLDSHHRFVRNWDDLTINIYENLRCSGIMKPLVTGYLPPYVPGEDPRMRPGYPYRIYPLGREEGILTRLTSYPLAFPLKLTGPVPADFFSLHFAFTAGTFNKEVAVDPQIYFFGDETLMGLRAFTSGYDMFHPHCVIGWHCYERRTRIPHWDDHQGWHEQHCQSLRRMRRIINQRKHGRFGLGKARTVEEYEDLILVPLISDQL
jgi:hypothetical protein